MRDNLTILCVGALVLGIVGGICYYNYPHSIVYACSDKELNPPEIQQQCQKLTRGQWWSK